MYSNKYKKMIGIFTNLPDDLIKHVKQFMRPTPTAEIMKTHIQRWTGREYFHLWFRDHNRKVLTVLRTRAYKRMKYIKDRQDDIIKLSNKRGENMTIEKLINRNYQQSKIYEQYNKSFWLYVE
jgi:hypothetical protein